jgi:hypothetical protein
LNLFRVTSLQGEAFCYHCPSPTFLQISGPFGLSLASLSLELFMLLPILLLSAAGFTVLTTEFVIVGLLPSIARDLEGQRAPGRFAGDLVRLHGCGPWAFF